MTSAKRSGGGVGRTKQATRAKRTAEKVPRSAATESDATAAELLAAIRADPTDDGARQVYADVLVANGDPHGELIALQLARVGRKPTAVERKRELALVRKHVRAWLGELTAVTGPLTDWNLAVGPTWEGAGVHFERGFLASIALRGGAKKISSVAGDPRFATVEELRVDQHADQLLPAQAFPALRRLVLDVDGIAVAVRQPFAKRLSEIMILASDHGARITDAVAACAGFSALRRLDIRFAANRIDEHVVAAVRTALAMRSLEQVHVDIYSEAPLGGSYVRTPSGWRFTKGAGTSTSQAAALKRLA